MSGSSLSAALIVRDEEAVLPHVLADLRDLAEEIVVVDTGSADSTVELARRSGALVFHYEWKDDFASARNYSFERCSGDWIIWVDADDRIPKSSQMAMCEAKKQFAEMTADALYVPYRLRYADESESSFIGCNNRVRIVRRSRGFQWRGRIHEALHGGNVETARVLDAWVEHRPLADSTRGKLSRDRRILENVIRGGERSASSLLHYGLLLANYGEFESALAILEECLVVCGDVGPRYVAMMVADSCLAEMGDIRRRLNYLYDATRLDSSRAEAFLELGHVHALLGRYRSAIPLFGAALAASPPAEGSYSVPAYSWAPLVGLARSSWQVGEREEALHLLDRAAEVAPHRTREFIRIAEELRAGAGEARSRSLAREPNFGYGADDAGREHTPLAGRL